MRVGISAVVCPSSVLLCLVRSVIKLLRGEFMELKSINVKVLVVRFVRFTKNTSRSCGY